MLAKTEREVNAVIIQVSAVLSSINARLQRQVLRLGSLKVDYTMFVDWDEDCHGPMDTRSNRRDYPENFKWDCCYEDGTMEGCREHKHTSRNKKRRV
jgi:hypothetical protein